MDQLIQENLRSVAWFRPELALTFGALALFVLDLFWRKSAARLRVLTLATLAVLAVAAAYLAAQPVTPQPLFNGLLANDSFAIFFKWLFLAAGALTVIIAAGGEDFPTSRVGEF